MTSVVEEEAKDDPDALASAREHRWAERYQHDEPLLPYLDWWPWPLDEVAYRDGDPATGMVAVDLLPVRDGVGPEAVIIRQPRLAPPFTYGWPGAAWYPEDDPDLIVHAYEWEEGPWRWTVFVQRVALSAEDVGRVRESIGWRRGWTL
ncbi:hypothetical protein ACIQZN_18940 [Streptomyces sp. NPDC097595]|uniref:hypothetical protein n=1 Tax=Streptomyces sp. NPDC097595 TaxID=3366090 RepID=UPI0037F2A564